MPAPTLARDVAVDSERIAETHQFILPYIRRTPVIEVDGPDFNLGSISMVMKLKLLQHSGSFKTRGAFADLLMRPVPPAAVGAASGRQSRGRGGICGDAAGEARYDLFANRRLPGKNRTHSGCGVDLIVAGDCYADALATGEENVSAS